MPRTATRSARPEVVNKKVKGARPHMLYQNTFYKGLDTNF
jgi:hypothetical protein